MRVKVSHRKCQGHARCAAMAPDLFRLDEDSGYILPGDIPVPPGAERRAQLGVRACPERALALDEET